MTAGGKERVLVIKLSALGDVVQALGPMAAIRRHHADADITVLTTAPFAPLIEAAGFCNRIHLDTRPDAIDVPGWLALRRFLRGGGFIRVYDLQTSGRSSRYRRLFWPGPYPQWSGIAAGCSHPHANPGRDAMHTLDRQAEQLRMAGIETTPAPNLDSVSAPVAAFDLPGSYAVLVPGGARHRPEKRWPVGNYAAIAKRLAAAGIVPVIVGGADERDLGMAIIDGITSARSLCGETSILELIAVIRGARFVLGNDSGPMHIAAALGRPATVLYSHASDPALCAQQGPDVTILRRPQLADLDVEAVWATLPAGARS